MPLVRLGELIDATQTIVEQDGLDPGGLKAQLAEVNVVDVLSFLHEDVPGGAAFQAPELGQLRGCAVAGQRGVRMSECVTSGLRDESLDWERAAVIGCEKRVGVVVDGGESERCVGKVWVVGRGHHASARGSCRLAPWLIRSSAMPVKQDELEQAIRNAFPVSHLDIEDISSGCGQSYNVIIVSEVGVQRWPR